MMAPYSTVLPCVVFPHFNNTSQGGGTHSLHRRSRRSVTVGSENYVFTTAGMGNWDGLGAEGIPWRQASSTALKICPIPSQRCHHLFPPPFICHVPQGAVPHVVSKCMTDRLKIKLDIDHDGWMGHAMLERRSKTQHRGDHDAFQVGHASK